MSLQEQLTERAKQKGMLLELKDQWLLRNMPFSCHEMGLDQGHTHVFQGKNLAQVEQVLDLIDFMLDNPPDHRKQITVTDAIVIGVFVLILIVCAIVVLPTFFYQGSP